MAYNPNIPTVTGNVAEQLDQMRENFTHLGPLAQITDDLQTVSGLAPIANYLQTVSELAPVVSELQAVSGLAPVVSELQAVSELAPIANYLQTVSELALVVSELQAVSGLAPIANYLQTVSALAPVANELQAVSGLAPVVSELQAVSEWAPYVQALLDSRIVEMDSNSNGTYVRWANGLQVCFASLTTSASQDTLWTLPAAFIDSGWVFSGGVVATFDSGAQVITFEGRTTNSITLRVFDASGNRVSGSAFIIAIGRWK